MSDYQHLMLSILCQCLQSSGFDYQQTMFTGDKRGVALPLHTYCSPFTLEISNWCHLTTFLLMVKL